MKKCLIAVLMIVSLVLANAPLGAPMLSEKPLFAQGKIKIQLTESAFSSGNLKIDNSSKSYSVTGFESIDMLNKENSAVNFRRAKSPYGSKKSEHGERAWS